MQKTRKNTQIILNGFKIKKHMVPKKFFKFSLPFFDMETESEIYKIVKTHYSGILLNSAKDPLIEVVSWKRPKTSDIKDCEEITIDSIPVKKQEEIISLFLRWEVKILEKLKNCLPLSIRKFDDFLAIPDVKRLKVLKFNDDFYLFFDIGYFIRSTKSVYELVKAGKFSYEDLREKEILYNPRGSKYKKRSLAKVVNIKYNPSKAELEKIKELLINKYGEMDLSYDVPILEIQFKGKRIYPTFPQCCYLEKRDFTNKLSISNEDRRKILEEMARNVDELNEDPLSIKGKVFNSPTYIVKTKNNKLKRVNKLKEVLKYPAFFVPNRLKKQKIIPTFILADKNIPERELLTFIRKQSKTYFKANREGNPLHFKLEKSSNGTFLHKVDFKNFRIPSEIKNKIQNYYLSFAICITQNILEDEYDKVKRKLFLSNIISQFVIYERWKKSSAFISQNLVLNIYTKVGIRQFTLAEKFPYDFIIGIDVGNDRFNRRSKAGGVSVFLSNGMFKTMFPLSIDTAGEKIDLLGEMLEILAEKLDLNNNRILILRDGNIYDRELEGIASSSILKEKWLSITVANIKKNHSFRILSDEGKKAVVINDNLGVLLPHSFKGARSLLVDAVYLIENGEIMKIPVTYDLLALLYKLTKINLSTLFREDCMLRLPAPLHYSDSFVKSLGRGWNVNDFLLSLGCLYFI